jgi:hypothetical protein
MGYLEIDERDLDQLLTGGLLEKELENELREEIAAQEVEAALSPHRATTLIIENEEGDEDENEISENPPLFTEGGVVFLNNNPTRFLFSNPSDSSEVESEFESAFNGVGAPDLRNSGFERRERLDVKKPGPWYRTVNNFAFDYEEKEKVRNVQAYIHYGQSSLLFHNVPLLKC